MHNLNAANDVLKVALSNTAPVATNTVFANITEITAGSGYTAGGEDTQNSLSRTANTTSVIGVDVVWTSTGTIGPFRYVVLYNDTPTSPADPLIGWWDNGSSVTLANGETFTVDFGASMFTVA
ncbi:MAG: hypothetical protein ACR2RF_32285 [Geminicoccaceae bacterium]